MADIVGYLSEPQDACINDLMDAANDFLRRVESGEQAFDDADVLKSFWRKRHPELFREEGKADA